MSRTSTARRELAVAAIVLLVVLAATMAMSRVFLDPAWIRPTLAAATLSVVTAAAARRIGLPALGALLLSGAGLVVFTYVVHLPAGPLVPGAAEFAVARQLLDDALIALREQPAPTDPLPELVFLVTLATWVVGFVTHELTVRLRRPGIALIAATALWVVPLSMPQPTQATARVTVPFLLAAAMLLLLESDADLAGWARERIAPRITVAGSTLALAAVGLGALAPWLLPGYGEPAVLDVGGSSDPRGYQPIVDIGDRLSLPADRTVLRVVSDRRVYLRLAALDSFDANTWRLGPPGTSSFVPDREQLHAGDEELPFETAIAETDTTVVDIEVVDLENIYVPVPYQPVQVNGDAAADMVWSRVGGFLATGELSENELGGTLRTGVTRGLQYQVVSAIPSPTSDQLRAAEPEDRSEVEPWLQLPGDADRWRRYAEQAQQVYDSTGAQSSVDRALALQYWFTTSGGFEYALDGIEPLRGPNPLESFVFETKTGYCEYFATAMALMLRASGIPARVAVGFLPGELVLPPDPEAGEERGVYEVSTSDAHAWVEVLFPGQGWIKFDPTPRADGTTLAPDEENIDPQLLPQEAEELLEETDDTVPVPETPDRTAPDLPEVAGDGTGGGDTQGEEQAGPLPVLAAALAALVAVAGVVALRRRGPRVGEGRTAALHAQRRVLHTAARLGVPRHDSETAGEALHRWASEGRCDPTASAELAAAAQRAAFAPPDATIDGTRALDLADRVVDGLQQSADTTARVLAPVRVPVTQAMGMARGVVDSVRDRLRV